MIKGLSSNVLKIIAIIIMIIDHITLYMYQNFDYFTYYALRGLGRIAMPIFAYLIVQGFFYTKNLSKYIFRLFILATVTQTVLFAVGVINQRFYPDYRIGMNEFFGVLYSYVLSLILISVIDRKIVIKKISRTQNLLLRISVGLIIALIYLKLKIEFDLQVPILILQFYAIEKLFKRNNELLLKYEQEWTMKRAIYIVLSFVALSISILFLESSLSIKYALLLSIGFIALYNGERGKKNKLIQYFFYLVFPLQHMILYLLAMAH